MLPLISKNLIEHINTKTDGDGYINFYECRN